MSLGLAAGRPNPHPNPTFDPTCESRNALFLLGSSHGCKATHEALPHADPRLRSRRGLQLDCTLAATFGSLIVVVVGHLGLGSVCLGVHCLQLKLFSISSWGEPGFA